MLAVILTFLAEPARIARQRSTIASKFGNPSIREILVVTTAYVPRPYRLWGRGRGVPRQPDGGWRMPSFFWREKARCFLATGVFLGGKSYDHRCFWKRGLFKSLACLAERFSSTELKFGTWKNISNIYKWKEEVQKNTQLSFWWKAKSSNY